MESLRSMNDAVYYIEDNIDEAMAYLDDIKEFWRSGKAVDDVRIARCKSELKEALKMANRLKNSIACLVEGEELER